LNTNEHTDAGCRRVVDATDIAVSFDNIPVLKGVSLYVDSGETLVVLGASGSGKSVLMSCVVGLLSPDRGSIIVFGEEVSTFRRERDWNSVRLRIGYLFQGGALFDSMTVGENIAFAPHHHTSMNAAEIAERVERNLALVGLEGTEDKMPSELSGGMQKRAALARALSLDPELIVYDEPTTGLDPIRADSISVLIRRLQTELHSTALVVTHDLACTETVADRVVLLHEGKFIAEGTMPEIRGSADPRVRAFIAGKAPPPADGPTIEDAAYG
jgi:phospholipid/cholesterol/gamma-HCH transport system ATP-binding protein